MADEPLLPFIEVQMPTVGAIGAADLEHFVRINAEASISIIINDSNLWAKMMTFGQRDEKRKGKRSLL